MKIGEVNTSPFYFGIAVAYIIPRVKSLPLVAVTEFTVNKNVSSQKSCRGGNFGVRCPFAISINFFDLDIRLNVLFTVKMAKGTVAFPSHVLHNWFSNFGKVIFDAGDGNWNTSLIAIAVTDNSLYIRWCL